FMRHLLAHALPLVETECELADEIRAALSPGCERAIQRLTHCQRQAARSIASMLEEFHRVFVPEGLDVRSVRKTLLQEEHEELQRALESGDRLAIAQELADLLYVTYGTALVYQIDADVAVAEVHRANMSKLGPDGKPILREDGKVLKGPNYKPPDMSKAIGRQA